MQFRTLFLTIATLWVAACRLIAIEPAGPGAFFSEYCVRCHGEKKQKGDLRLDTLAADFQAPLVAMHWADIMDRISAGEMPPDDVDKRPTADEASHVVEWISAQLNEAEATRLAHADRVTFHKLTRDEYGKTMRDLLGVTCDVSDPTGLPEDPDWHGFERLGSVLTISPAHIEKCMAAANQALAEALAIGPEPKIETTVWNAANMRMNGPIAEALETRGIVDKVRVDLVPNNGALDAHDLRITTAGDYRVRVKLSGLRATGGRAARLRLYATDLNRTLFEQDVEAPEDQPLTIEFKTHLPVGTHLIRVVNAVPGPNPEERASRPLATKPFFTMNARQPWQIKLTDDDGKPIWPTVILDSIEWSGPMHESWPPPAHQQIFFAGPGAEKSESYAREILRRFASRAWRRPVEDSELDRVTGLYRASQERGESFEESVRQGLLAILCSNNFLYLVEGEPDVMRTHLNDWELASRLSYFLWSSMPDAHLCELAQQGKLHDRDVLLAETRRMMADPKGAAFAESFPRQWLQLRRVGMFAPDRKLYPEYDEYLEKSMIAESTSFFRAMLEGNLGLGQFLDSDWTMVNERLAAHYDIQGVVGEGMRRVDLRPDDHRGGLLTQAAVLSLTSDGTRHRPVHRGKWVLESIFDRPPPPPPANVPALKTSAPGEPKKSVRAKLEAHREDANCAACHRKIDPLGLAFDNYDAVGHWRTQEDVRDGAGTNPVIDASGELPDGRKFRDAEELKKLLAGDLDRFAFAVASKLTTYGLRRSVSFDDRKSIAEIAHQGKAEGYPLRSLVENLVLSDLFQKR